MQKNAIRSWLALGPACQVVLIDDEEGTTPDATLELGVQVVTRVKRSRLGAPLLDDLLRVGANHAQHGILAYITADVMLPPNFPDVALACHHLMNGRPYFAAGARIDLMQPMSLDFDDPAWFDVVRAAVSRYGKPHRHTALDLWVYPREQDLNPPPFPIGRSGTDGWAVWAAKRAGIATVDFTSEVLLVHQFHDRPAKRNPLFQEELHECVALFDNMAENALSLLDFDWILEAGRLRRPRGFRRLHSAMSLFRPYRFLVGQRRKRNLPHLYGAWLGASGSSNRSA